MKARTKSSILAARFAASLVCLFFGTALRAASATGNAGGERLEFKILKVFAANDGGHLFRAYAIEWDGQEVVVVDALAWTKYRTDDAITILVQRAPYPKGQESYGLLNFTLSPPRQGPRRSSDAEPQTSGSVSSTQAGYADFKVLRVFSARDGNDVFRAYVVEWNGHEVVVSDALVKNQCEVGDTIKAVVMKHPNPAGAENGGLMAFEAVPPTIAKRIRKR